MIANISLFTHRQIITSSLARLLLESAIILFFFLREVVIWPVPKHERVLLWVSQSEGLALHSEERLVDLGVIQFLIIRVFLQLQ